jgi:hypothetical protein
VFQCECEGVEISIVHELVLVNESKYFLLHKSARMIMPDFRHLPRNIRECVRLGYYAASTGNSLPTFRDNLSVPSSRIKSLLGFM